MDALLATFGVVGVLIAFVFAVMMFIAPLGIWNSLIKLRILTEKQNRLTEEVKDKLDSLIRK